MHSLARFFACMLAAAGALLAAVHATPASAQPAGYPARPIRLVVPFAAGGTADAFGRIVGQALGERIGQPVVVDNKPGGGGVIAADLVAKAAPDGYTLLVADVGANAVAPGLFPKLPYDALKDFAPVVLGTTVPMVLIANPALPANDLRALLALARAKPGSLNFGSAGAGGISHLAGEMMKIQAQLDMVHVAYKGGSQSLAGILGGETQIMFVTGSSALPQIRSGKVRAIAVASTKKAVFLPDVPTMADAGMPGFVADSWSGIMAPAATPRPVIDYLARELRAVLQTPAIHKQLTDRGFDVLAAPPEEFARFLAQEVQKWGTVIRTAGVKPE